VGGWGHGTQHLDVIEACVTVIALTHTEGMHLRRSLWLPF
jgi:hypothetical protein